MLTIDNLRKCQLVVLVWCYMCKVDGENIDHLFLHFSIARDLWDLVFSMFGVWWVMLCHVMELLACWQGRFKQCRSAAIWSMFHIVSCGMFGGSGMLDL